MFYKIINGLAQLPFECVLIEAYKGTRRKHNIKFRQIGHTTSQYGQSFFPNNNNNNIYLKSNIQCT